MRAPRWEGRTRRISNQSGTSATKLLSIISWPAVQPIRDFATPEEIQAEREEAQQAKQRFIYSRRWMAETDEQAETFRSEGRPSVVRLKMPRDGRCEFDDEVRGLVTVEWALEQDHVIQRGDGSVLYHLASTVDDHEFRISHVIRAVEHLSNTPRQMFIRP